jgi:hypothetical protein
MAKSLMEFTTKRCKVFLEGKTMSVMTAKKPFEGVLSKVEAGENLFTLVVGCNKCAKISKTGGTEATLEMIKPSQGTRR